MATATTTTTGPHILLLEPFYGGSHKQLLDLLRQELPGCIQHTMPAKKWHWRARTAALYMSQAVPASDSYRVLFCSSVLNLAELVALRPDLAKLRKIVYFHENQLVYPIRKQQERDFQYGYNQVLSCLVADECVFNSRFNMESFLSNVKGHMKLIPDHRPRSLADTIRPKCRVLHFPIRFPSAEPELGKAGDGVSSDSSGPPATKCESCGNMVDKPVVQQSQETPRTPEELEHCRREVVAKPLHIVWPHRWEHDKDPDMFFQILYQLKEHTANFKVSVLGETYSDVPEIFEEAREKLSSHIHAWGYQASKAHYHSILREADVVVSTAKHEFFGVAMLEATHLGCYPLCPNALVYPEIFPAPCLYNTSNQLLKKLNQFCQRPDLVCKQIPKIDIARFSWESLAPQYKSLLTGQTPITDTTKVADASISKTAMDTEIVQTQLTDS